MQRPDLPAGAAAPTPGPWRAEGAHHLKQGSHAFIVGGPFIVATVHADLEGLRDQAPSNLRLLAAVPHLAAACEATLALLMDGTLVLGSANLVTEQRTKIFAMRALLSAGIDFGPRRDPFAAMEALLASRPTPTDGGRA